MGISRLILLTLVTTVVTYNTVLANVLDWKNLHAKFSFKEGMYKIPLTISQIKNNEYVWVDRDEDLNVDLFSHPNDPRVLLLFDTLGKLAGVRQTFILNEIAKKAEANNLEFPYEFYSNKPLFTKGRYWDQNLWYSTVLFQSPDVLRTWTWLRVFYSVWGRGSARYEDGLLGEQVYLKLDWEGWKALPRRECDAEARGFTRQTCYPGMGQHYFYGMTSDADCMGMQGVLIFYEREELVGLAITGFGQVTSLGRSWYDDPPTSVIESILVAPPKCMLEFVNKYGLISLHLYFKEIPELSICEWPWQRNDACPRSGTYMVGAK